MQPAIQHAALLGEITLVLSGVLGVCAGVALGWAARTHASTPRGSPWRIAAWLCAVDLAGVALFCALAHVVVSGATAKFDRSFEMGIHHYDTPTTDVVMHAFTDIGSPLGIAIIVVAVGILALVLRRWRVAVGVATVAVVSGILVEVLKLSFGRIRPQLFHEVPPLHSFSFPSGHSFGSSAVFATLAIVVSRVRPRLTWLAFVVAALLTLCIGLSRIYLGVHWPTDVLAGFFLGSLVALNAAAWFRRNVPRGPPGPRSAAAP